MGKIIISLLVLFSIQVFSQNNKVIEIKANDSITLSKDSKKLYYLKIFYKKNISYNKKHNLTPTKYAGDLYYCNNCKKEYDIYTLKPSSKPKNNVNFYLKDFILTKKGVQYFNFEKFYNNYFKINNSYYKLIGHGPID